MNVLLTGLVTGILFGFLLQKGNVLRYDRQVGTLRLLDMTIIKFMFSTVLVSMVGVYILKDLDLIALAIKPTNLGGNIIGGLIFGVGWGLLGYCPGTSLGALGEGRWDAVWGMAGMIIGAGLYAEVYPFMKSTVLTWGAFGELTLSSVLGINHWIVITALFTGAFFLFRWFQRKGL